MTPETQPPLFGGIPEPGTPIKYWPQSVVGGREPPLVGMVKKGWEGGQADIGVFPPTDGAVLSFESVFHIGDPRLFDSRGNITLAGEAKGCWEFADHVKPFFEPKEEAETAEEVKPATKSRSSKNKS